MNAPIDKAAEAVYERAFGQELPEAPVDLARAAFASIDTDELARVIAGYLLNYTLPANYGPPLADEDHVDVADRCGPLIAEAVRAHLLAGAPQ